MQVRKKKFGILILGTKHGLNVDASFVEATGQACTGAVVRNHRGHVVVVVSSWCVLFDCLSAEEVEIAACCEGLRLVSQWCHGWNQITTQYKKLDVRGKRRIKLAPRIVDAKEYMSNLEEVSG